METVPDFPLADSTSLLSDMPSAASVSNGLVWAIACQAGHRPVRLDDGQIVHALEGGSPPIPDSWVWLHYDIVHTASRAHIQAIPCLPEEVRLALGSTDRGTNVEAEGDIVYGALPGFDDAMSEDDKNLSAWRFAVLPDLLITTRRQPVPALGMVYRALQRADSFDSPAEVVDYTCWNSPIPCGATSPCSTTSSTGRRICC